MSPNVLLIFLKVPEPGKVKTRLQPQFSPQQSFLLYQAMGKDLVDRHRNTSAADVLIAHWPADGEQQMRRWLGEDLQYFPQQGDNLGAKMSTAFEEAFSRGYAKAVIIGSDLPYLHPADIEAAFSRLESCDCVLGPADDGGYYLIGKKCTEPQLFDDVVWSSATVLEKTLANARAAALRVELLQTLPDIDTWKEVRELWQRLQTDPELGAVIPATRQVLKNIMNT